MIKIISQLDAGKYTVITLDSPLPNNWDKKVKINGEEYQTEIVYDLPNSLGIIGKGDFVGRNIIFV